MSKKYEVVLTDSAVSLYVMSARGCARAEFTPEGIPGLCADLMQAMADVKEIRSVELVS